MVSKVIIPRKI